MRPAYLCALVTLGSCAHALMPISAPLQRGRPSGKAIPPPLRANEPQRPIMDAGPGLALPPGTGGDETSPNPPPDQPAGGPGAGAVMLSDVMGRDRNINVFAGLARDVEAVAARLDDPSRNSTVLAPLNSAVDRLPRKPWEDPAEMARLGADAYEGDGGRERALRNLRRFVEAHVVPKSPWPEGDKVRALNGSDGEVWWEWRDGVMVIQPGHIEVVSVASSVANGQVWILKGVRDYSRASSI